MWRWCTSEGTGSSTASGIAGIAGIASAVGTMGTGGSDEGSGADAAGSGPSKGVSSFTVTGSALSRRTKITFSRRLSVQQLCSKSCAICCTVVCHGYAATQSGSSGGRHLTQKQTVQSVNQMTWRATFALFTSY